MVRTTRGGKSVLQYVLLVVTLFALSLVSLPGIDSDSCYDHGIKMCSDTINLNCLDNFNEISSAGYGSVCIGISCKPLSACYETGVRDCTDGEDRCDGSDPYCSGSDTDCGSGSSCSDCGTDEWVYGCSVDNRIRWWRDYSCQGVCKGCASSDGSSTVIENCNDYDDDSCPTCNGVGTATISLYCDDWSCNPTSKACEDTTNDYLYNSWTCGSGNECSSVSCGGTKYCYKKYDGGYVWGTGYPAKELNCADGNNDCDTQTDCHDSDCYNTEKVGPGGGKCCSDDATGDTFCGVCSECGSNWECNYLSAGTTCGSKSCPSGTTGSPSSCNNQCDGSGNCNACSLTCKENNCGNGLNDDEGWDSNTDCADTDCEGLPGPGGLNCCNDNSDCGTCEYCSGNQCVYKGYDDSDSDCGTASCPTGASGSTAEICDGSGTCTNPAYKTYCTETTCNDKVDNDDDGLKDCKDPDCYNTGKTGPNGDLCCSGDAYCGTCKFCDSDDECNDRGYGFEDSGCGTTSCDSGASGSSCNDICDGSGSCTDCSPSCSETDCTDDNNNDNEDGIDCQDSDCPNPGTPACNTASCNSGNYDWEYTPECFNTAKSCGCNTPCTDCTKSGTTGPRTGNGCSGSNYITYNGCSSNSCTYSSDDCTDCSCSCDGYKQAEDTKTLCEDGKDNDCNDKADCADPNCADWCAEDCTNNVDDDTNGDTDCQDSACPASPPNSCYDSSCSSSTYDWSYDTKCDETDTNCGCTSCSNCDSSDGWVEIDNRWVDHDTNSCKEKEQNDKGYWDYRCAGGDGGSCTYSETSTTGWQDTGSTRNKPDGTSCDDGDSCTSASSCQSGTCTATANYCSGSNSNCGCDSCTNCNSQDSWYDTGSTQTVSTGECTERYEKQQVYRNYKCSGTGCDYDSGDTRWVQTGTGDKADGTSCNDDDSCTSSSECQSGTCTGTANYCTGTDANCGCSSCSNCDTSGTGGGRTGDGCSGNNYIDYYCAGTACGYNSDDCTDCSCSCNNYNQAEDTKTLCEDGKDNDCSNGADCADPSCSAWCAEDCTNNNDDDSNSYIDCQDSACPASPPNTCYDSSCSSSTYDWSYNLICSGSDNNCGCDSCSDCDISDNWFATGTTQWVDHDTNACREKEQKEEQYRDYQCTGTEGSCTFTVLSTHWVDTGNTRDKTDGTSCDDSNICTDNDVCTTGNCAGSAILSCTNGDGCCPAGCDGIDTDCGGAVCGDGSVEDQEVCEPPNTEAVQCSESTVDCDTINHRYGTRDGTGQCSGDCRSCLPDPFVYVFDTTEGSDYCNNCNHCGDGQQNCGETALDVGGPCDATCGDGSIEGTEICEPPNDPDNCAQPLYECDEPNLRYGTRVGLGTCSNDCKSCVPDTPNWSYITTTGSNYCNTCEHCTDGALNCDETTTDSGGSCGAGVCDAGDEPPIYYGV